jgi:Protein of unknown function (DUF5674)
MEIRIVREPLSVSELAELAAAQFGDFVKAVVDVERNIMAIGGELHADEESALLQDGSRQPDLWGVNLYPAMPEAEWIEFDSMFNVKPGQKNRTRGVDDPERRRRIVEIVARLVRR